MSVNEIRQLLLTAIDHRLTVPGRDRRIRQQHRIAGSGEGRGFHRYVHAFHDPHGPPSANTTSGCGPSPSGRTSHARIGVPSSAVASTSVRVPSSSSAVAGFASSLMTPVARSIEIGMGATSIAEAVATTVSPAQCEAGERILLLDTADEAPKVAHRPDRR